MKKKALPLLENWKYLLGRYSYIPALTKKLDARKGALDREGLYEIVLWKLNRFPEIDDDLIEQLNTVRKMKESNDAKTLLKKLISTPGIRLPMASTILRFLNPRVFQIIDDRAYRAACHGKPKYPSKPPSITLEYIENSVEIYFSYLGKVRKLAEKHGFAFEDADRILYQLDIEQENKIGN